jgi:hypothetical protein
MSRSSRAEVERRVDEIFELVVSRVTYRTIIAHCEKKWGIRERQARIYLAKARERIIEIAKEGQEERLAKALASYEALYRKQLSAARLSDARQTLDSIVKLLGLAAPERVEVYDFSTYSDKQLAQEVARELPELAREAERFTRGAPPPDGDEGHSNPSVGPPHPDAEAEAVP